ncbi:MAG: T9SS type A sorting domain-containing protein [Rhodothermaceae bacterium]|nr:T9SS type A sorting domain-containing protein [Rhodothermaceae bacterium]
MDSLQRLLLAGNQLTGPIPSELGNLDNLEDLSLHSNPFTSGPIPPELFNLRNLTVLNLSRSQLTGKIPPELGNLTNLEFLSLTENQLSGPIPPELGRLRKLRSLVLRSNQLTGEIPPELGNLLNLNYLNLQGNALSGTIPPELGQLVNIGANTSTLFDATPDQIHGRFDVSKNKLTGALPQSFVHFNHLDYLNFESNSGLCAPSNDEFQMWLDTIETVTGDTCSEVSFSEGIANQSYPRSLPIPPLILPESITGVLPIVYTWNVLELPFGLRYDPVTRTVSGAPTHVTPPVLFTYKATDAIGSKDSLQFSIEVYSAVAIERGVLPEKFELRTNYPNPFQHSTNIAFNLPWPAQIQIEVMDVIGRRMMSSIPVNMEAGWEQKIEVNRESLSSGHYLYRLIVESPTDRSIHVGHFTLVR